MLSEIKLALACNDDKRYVLDDNINTYAYGHKNIVRDVVKDNEIKKWSSSDCNTWLEKTKHTPLFLDRDSKEILDDLRVKINERLIELEIDGIESLFVQLNNDQQEKCLLRLKSLMHAN